MKHRLLMYAFFVASLALSTTASATTVINFETTVQDGGIFNGTSGSGTITYDETLLWGSGEEYLYLDLPYDLGIDTDYYDPANPGASTFALDITFDIFGQHFTTVNDADYTYFPDLTFIDGMLSFMNFSVNEAGPNITEINKAGINSFAMFDTALTTGLDGVYRGDLTVDGVVVSAVPVPAAAWLFGTGLLGLIGFGRRKINQA